MSRDLPKLWLPQPNFRDAAILRDDFEAGDFEASRKPAMELHSGFKFFRRVRLFFILMRSFSASALSIVAKPASGLGFAYSGISAIAVFWSAI
jgi:hypothetical protein